MALAQLREVSGDADTTVLEIDTGTNPLFRVQLGTGVRTVDGLVVLDDAYWSSPWQRNQRAGRHLDTTTSYRLDRRVADRPRTLVQVQSAKDAEGRGRAFSTPVRLDAAGLGGLGGFDELPQLGSAPGEGTAMSLSLPSGPAVAPRASVTLRPARTSVPHRTARQEFSRAASFDDLLGTLVQVAGPLLRDLLGGDSGGAGGGGTAGAGGISIEAIGDLLRSVLSAAGTPIAPIAPIAPVTPVATDGAAAAGPAGTTVGSAVSAGTDAGASTDLFSTPESARVTWSDPWRGGRGGRGGRGDADPLLRLAGSLAEVLPQLLNAIADRHTRHCDAQPARDVLGDRERLRLLRLLSGGRSGGRPVPEAPDRGLEELRRLLADAPVPTPVGTPVSAAADTPAAGSPGGTPARAQSLAVAPPAIASKAVLSPILGTPLPRASGPRAVFTTTQAVTLRFQLDVGADGPAAALPRAILEVTVREPGGATDLVSRTTRLTDVRPGSPLSVQLSPEELAALPSDVDLEAAASLRWRTSRGTYRAACATPFVIAPAQSVVADGAIAGESRELTDMTRFRPFWNRVWATAEGAAAAGDGEDATASLWGFDAAVRYSVVLVGSERGNGLMQTKTEPGAATGGVRAVTNGRVKAGIEVSVAELNALLPLWDGGQPLPAETLAAFAAPPWRAARSGDATLNVRFEGRKRTRGVLWAVPVVGLRTYTVATASTIDPYGQIVALTQQEVRFPAVESVRLLGLASTIDEESADPTASGYRFDGYEVVFDTKTGLEAPTGGRS